MLKGFSWIHWGWNVSTLLILNCVSPTRDWTWAIAMKAQNSNHWATRELPWHTFLISSFPYLRSFHQLSVYHELVTMPDGQTLHPHCLCVYPSIFSRTLKKRKFSHPWPIRIFFYGCAGSSLPRGFFPSCGKQELLSSCGVMASHWGSCSCCRAWALECVGFSSCSTQAQ